MSDADVPVVVFDNTAPSGRSYSDHVCGGQDGEPFGLPQYLMELADQAKGFRCLVVDPTTAALLDFALNLGITAFRRRGAPSGIWRGYPVFVDPELGRVGGYLAEHFGGRPFGILSIVNI